MATVADPAGYSGTPLPRKLGIKAGHRVLLVDAPADFDPRPLPEGVTVHERGDGEPYDVIVAFAADRKALERHQDGLPALMTAKSALWLCWPKKSSGVVTDVGEQLVRESTLARPDGLVDVKVAAIDATWSSLKFVFRLTAR